MSNVPNDGGPAYPGPVNLSGYGNAVPHVMPNGEIILQEMSSGMSLRDYFAGEALNGILRAEDGDDGEPPLNGRACGEYARQAYSLADAMLVERAKKGGES